MSFSLWRWLFSYMIFSQLPFTLCLFSSWNKRLCLTAKESRNSFIKLAVDVQIFFLYLLLFFLRLWQEWTISEIYSPIQPAKKPGLHRTKYCHAKPEKGRFTLPFVNTCNGTHQLDYLYVFPPSMWEFSSSGQFSIFFDNLLLL